MADETSVVESGVNDSGRKTLRKGTGVEKEGNKRKGFLRIIALKISKRVRLFVTRGISRGGSDGFAESFDNFKNEGVIGEANAEGTGF